jgi:hypothetical protein
MEMEINILYLTVITMLHLKMLQLIVILYLFQYNNDISAYTVERTLDMEKRAKMLREIKLGRRGTVSACYEH